MEKKFIIQRNSFICKTNRQFYSRRKKSPGQNQNPKMEKALNLLIKQSGNQQRKFRRENLKTQKSQQSHPEISKIDGLETSRKNLSTLLGSTHPGWISLYKSFQNIFQCVSLKKVEEAQVQFYERFYQLASIQQELKKQNESIKIRKKSKQNNNLFFIENLKLEKENIMLRKQITKNFDGQASLNRTKFCGNQQQIQQEASRTVALERQLTTKIHQNQIIKKQLEYIRDQLIMLRDEKKNLQERITQFKIKNQNLCSEIISHQLKNKCNGLTTQKNQWIMLMQKEEIQSYQREVHDQLRIYANLSRKYNSLLSKFKKTKTDTNCKIAVLYSRQSQLFPEQLEAFEEIRTKNSGMLMKLYTDSEVNHLNGRQKKIDKVLMYQQYLGAKESINNKQGVKKKVRKNNYSYHYPTFYHFVTEDIQFYGIDEKNYEHLNKKIKLTFLGTLRAILDSKYNQFLLSDGCRTISSFPSFVYSWLQTFQLDSDKKIWNLENSKCSTRQILSTFYVNLMSEKLNSSWEIITFRQFLLETLRADQLYYYLGLRFYLLNGDMLSKLDFCFEEIYYIDYSKAIKLIHEFVRQQDGQYIKILEQFIKKALIYNRRKNLLDLHYLLRTMLEYYNYVKQSEIEKLVKTIDIVTQNKKMNIGFQDFLKILEYHFDFLSLTEKTELYKKCYCTGRGIVNFQAFMTVLNSEHIFVGWVKKVFLSEHIKLQEKEGESSSFIITPENDLLPEIEQIYRYLNNAQIQREICSTGIQHLYKSVKLNTKLNSFTLHDRLEQCFKMCMFISKKMFRSGNINISEACQSILLTSEFLLKLSKKTMQKHQIINLMQSLKYQSACSKIVKFYQKKKYEMTRSIMYVYSNNSVKNQEEQKNETIRTEFLNIITEMKNKNKYSHKFID